VSCHAATELHKKKSSSSRVNCNTYCNGTDDHGSIAHSKKGTSLPKENTPDKCGLWAQGSSVVSGTLSREDARELSCSCSSTLVAAV
jgi:hypothetical protein